MTVVQALSNRIFLASVVACSLLLASCGKTASDVPQIPPVKTADATFGATPNPIVVTDGTGIGVTKLSWTTTKAKVAEIRVASPNGSLLAAGGAEGSGDTGKWVTDGMKFYLQDASGPNKTDASATLAVLTVKVISQQ